MSPILGVDFGTVRIGVSISDELRLLAHPFETISTKAEVTKRIAEVVREKGIHSVVVGIPRKMSGEIGKAAKDTLEFVDKLRAILPCQVIPWDERLTTAAAHRALRDAGRKTRATRHLVDQVAAQMILQSYLDQQREVAPAKGMLP